MDLFDTGIIPIVFLTVRFLQYVANAWFLITIQSHKLAAIMFTDMVWYTAFKGEKPVHINY